MFGTSTIVLSILLFVCLIWLLLESVEMNKKFTKSIIFISFILAWILAGFIPILIQLEYKKGQIDALSGKIKYEKSIVISKPDTTVVWKKIKK